MPSQAKFVKIGFILFTLLAVVLLVPRCPGWVLTNLGSTYLTKALILQSGSDQNLAESLLLSTQEHSSEQSNLWALYVQSGQPRKAVQAYQTLGSQLPTDPLSAYWLGQAYWDSGDKHAAREIWRRSGAIDGKLNYLVWLCWHSVEQGDTKAAEAALREAIDLDPEYGPAYDALASILWGDQTERYADIVWALQQAVKYLPPDSTPWYWNAGRLDMLHGDWAAAADKLRVVVSRTPAEWPLRFLMDALQRSGDVAGASQIQTEIEKFLLK